MPPYAADEPIEAFWPEDDQWLPATLLQAFKDGSYRVAWDADGSESVVPGNFVRRREAEGGPSGEADEDEPEVLDVFPVPNSAGLAPCGIAEEEEATLRSPRGPSQQQRQPLARLRGAQRDMRPAWMTKGVGVGTAILGEATGDLLKPGMTRSDLEALERRGLFDGPDPFGDVFRQSESGRDAMDRVARLPPPPPPPPKRDVAAVVATPPPPLAAAYREEQRQQSFEVPEEEEDDGCGQGEVLDEAEADEPTFEHLQEHSFDGRPEAALDFPYSADGNPPGSFSVDFWVRPRGGSGYRAPVASRDVPARGYTFFITPQGRWAFWVGLPEKNEWAKVDGPPVRDGEWQRVTGVHDAAGERSALRLLVDGEEVGSRRPASAVEANGRRPLRLGGGATEGVVKFPFSGDVRGLRIYARALAEPLPPEQLEGDVEQSLEEIQGQGDDCYADSLAAALGQETLEDDGSDEVYDVAEPPLKRPR